MKIVIPMSGIGKRFIDAGYKDPKPLIEVDGKPIIEHVVNLFPGEKDFIFICNSEHLQTTNMKQILERIAPECRIVEIPPHKKGPVFAVSYVFDLLDDDEEVIVNYCDFAKYWNYDDFLSHTRNRVAEGAIPSYRGFHPHMLGTTNYAFMRDENQWLLEIREKQPFTDNRMQEYASDGTYYFRRGSLVKKYFRQVMDEDVNVNGEYYVSMVYNLLRRDGLAVSIYDVQHMLQWGTPRDLEEYAAWSEYFRRLTTAEKQAAPRENSVNLIPLAGRGKRFADDGYLLPKPLIPISGKPMILRAAMSLPTAEKNVFVCLAEHLDQHDLALEIRSEYLDARIIRIEGVTEGQACTCEIGLDGVDPDASLLIGACDNGMLWNCEIYEKLLDEKSADVIIWGLTRHPSIERNPQMYGWIQKDGSGKVHGVSVKKPISADPYNDYAIVGTFYFRKASFFTEALRRMYEKNARVNGEFYVDSAMNEAVEMGLDVRLFAVDAYICWGTPDDLRTYEYWQSFFHKCQWHPYSLQNDRQMIPEAVKELSDKYTEFTQRNQ